MKKLILPLLLLVAFGMLAAVESDPSNIVGYVKYTTSTGKNAVALPMSASYIGSGAKAFGMSFSGTVTGVARWNNSTKQWNTVTRITNTNWGGTDYTLNGADPLLLTTTAAFGAAWYSIGDLPATMPTWAFTTGANQFSIPLNDSALSTVALLATDMTTSRVTAFARMNNTTKQWVTATKIGTNWSGTLAGQTLNIGDPMRVTTNTGFTWPGAKLSK